MEEFDWNNYLEANKSIAVSEELFSHVSKVAILLFYSIFSLILFPHLLLNFASSLS